MTQKIKLFTYIVILFFIVALGRSFYLQVLNGQKYKRISFWQSYQLTKTDPDRGIIYDKFNVPLVTNQTKYQISLYKPNIDISPDEVQALVGTDSAQINNLFSNPDLKWVDLKTLVDQDKAKSLSDITGIVINPVNLRYYPETDLATDVLGTLAKNKYNQFTGYDGLEGYYNQRLSGKAGFIWQTKDASGIPILSHLNWSKPKIDGTDIYISLDRFIQSIVEEELTKAVNDYQADSASAIVMDTYSGQILAMSTKESTISATLKNRVIADLYEPGSIFKPITLSIALDSLSIDQDFICDQCTQNRSIDGHQIANWNFENHPDSNLFDIIKNSDNIGMTYIMDQIDFDTFLDYAKKFGLYQKTGIDLQGEAKPRFTKNFWSNVDKATASFGQGFAITNIQMISAFNVIAADGLYYKPHLATSFGQNTSQKNVNLNSFKILNQTTTDLIKSILKYTVDNSNVSKLNTSHLDICAKSGTAQIAQDGQYGQLTDASYIGFTPCLQPKYTISVTVRRPQTTPWGATTAAPTWFSIVKRINQISN